MLRITSAILVVFALLMPFASQATTFKIASIAPDGTSWMNEMRKGADEIKARTDGRVSFRFYPGGIMGNDKSVLRKIRAGQLQGGAVTGGGVAEIYPEANVYSIPFLFRSYSEVDYVREHMDPVLLAGLKQKDFISFGFSEGGFAYLMSTSPIAGLDDLKGHKVWVPEGDEISRAAFEATNVSPVSLPLTDVLTGLQTGLIDTVAGSAMGAIALQWHTRVKYLTDAPLAYLYGSMVLKRQAFEKLSPADQKIVYEIMSSVFSRLNKLNREDNGSAMKAIQDQGIKIVEPDPAERERWRKSVNVAMDKLLQNGLFKAEMLDRVEDLLSKYRKAADVR
jgi:TRAP-type C4-dicarboxylate transport system substrate-binding protein